MRRFGLIWQEDEDDGVAEGVWQEHMGAVQAFLAVSTQWRCACPGDGSIRRTGLDYAAARAGLRLAGVKVTPALWSDIQLIEAGAIAAGFEAAGFEGAGFGERR